MRGPLIETATVSSRDLESEMADSVRNVFISHAHEDDDRLGEMKQLVQNKGLQIRDGSINSNKPNRAQNEAYIKQQILMPQIRWASVLVVLISPETHRSDWVNWEVEQAERLDKRIVGVWAHGAKDSDLPPALDKYADAVVGWQGDRIVGAIQGEINDWTTSSGEAWAARRIKRHDCGR